MTNERDRFMHAMAETIAELQKENETLRYAVRHSLQHVSFKAPDISVAHMQRVDMQRQYEARLRAVGEQKYLIRETLQMYRCNCKTVCEERKQAIKTGKTPKRTKCGWWAKKALKDTTWSY